MDLFGILGTALRRWYVGVPILIVGLVFSYQAYQAVVPAYSGTTTVVVLPSESDNTDDDGPSNPYGGSSGTEFAAAVLARNIDSAAFQQRLGVTSESDQSISADVSQDQPMIRIEAVAPNEGAVLALLDDVVAGSGQTLQELQEAAGAVPETIYRTARVVPVGEIEDVTPSRFRMAGAILALAGLAAVVAAVLVDSLLVRRRPRKDSSQRESSDNHPMSGERVGLKRPGRTASSRLASSRKRPKGRRIVAGAWPSVSAKLRQGRNGSSGNGGAAGAGRDGQPAHGEPVDGEPVDGEPVDGQTVNTQPADGERG